MCQRGNHIKFCSCSPGRKTPSFPYWVLYREVGQSYMTIMGDFLPPEAPSDDDLELIGSVAKALNIAGSFDFEYVPEDRDVFVLHVAENTSHSFECSVYHEGEQSETHWSYGFGPSLGLGSGGDHKQIKTGTLSTEFDGS